MLGLCIGPEKEAYMTQEQLIEHTKQLIAIPSTSDNPMALQQAVEYVANLLQTYCPEVVVERFDSNGHPSLLAYRGPERPARFDILLNGHVDVVPGRADQFKPYIEDGKLYGRGALDMKGTAVCLVDAFCEAVLHVPYQLGLQIVCDEEIGGYDGVRFQIDQGVQADFVVVGEYSNHKNTIYNAARGLCWAEIAFKGQSAHGGHLWHGTNALIKAYDFAAAILKRYPTPDEETWTTTANIASLSTPNSTYNRVPDQAVLKVDFRFTENDPAFVNLESLRAFIAQIDPDAELISTPVFEPAVNVAASNPNLQALSAALQRVTGQDVELRGRPAGSDGRHFVLQGSNIIEYGLYGQGSHGDQEHCELQSFVEYQKVLRDFLQQPKLEHKEALHEKALSGPLHEVILEKLVSMQTLSDDTAMNFVAIDYIQDFLTKRGMHCNRQIFDGYGVLLATTRASNAMQPGVLLSAHTDVARANREQFSLRIEDGKLYGRGVYDMKDAIAAYMALVDELQDTLSTYDFGILITTDEEYGNANGISGASRILEQGLKANVCILPDSAAPGWDIEARVKGPWRFELTANGKAAHGSRPWEGQSANEKLVSALHELHGLFVNQSHDTDSINIGIIHGGTEFNEVAITASASVEIRLMEATSIATYQAYVKKLCEHYNLSYTEKRLSAPLLHDLSHPYVQDFMSSIRAITGHTPQEVTSLGASEATYFTKFGIPCVVSCPNGGGHHSDNEWLDRKQFAQMVPILKDFLAKRALNTSQPSQSKAKA